MHIYIPFTLDVLHASKEACKHAYIHCLYISCTTCVQAYIETWTHTSVLHWIYHMHASIHINMHTYITCILNIVHYMHARMHTRMHTSITCTLHIWHASKHAYKYAYIHYLYITCIACKQAYIQARTHYSQAQRKTTKWCLDCSSN